MQRFFQATGGVFFLVATAATIWFMATSGTRVVSVSLSEGGVIAITADGTTYAGGSGKWIHFGSIRSGKFGFPKK